MIIDKETIDYPNENDLVPVWFGVTGVGTASGDVKIKRSSKKIKLWRTDTQRKKDAMEVFEHLMERSWPFDTFTNSFQQKVCWIEGVDPSDAARDTALTIDYAGKSDKVNITIYGCDLDIDSDNDNGVEPPEADSNEETIENDQSKPGKILLVNDGDVSGNNTPDFADGVDKFTGHYGDGLSPKFAQMILRIREMTSVSDVRVRFEYSASDPNGMSRSETQPYVYTPAPGNGRLGIWTKDGNLKRKKDTVAQEGDYVAPQVIYTAEQLGFTDSKREVPLYVEAASPGSPEDQNTIEVYIDANQSANEPGLIYRDGVRYTSTRVLLIPDFDRDGHIDTSDEALLATRGPLRIWINDDSDNGGLVNGDSDEPGALPGFWSSRSGQNCDNGTVDGRSDLLDFFPVALDIEHVASVLPVWVSASIEYRLRHNAGAVNFAYTQLTKNNAGDYLVTDLANCGNSLSEHSYQASCNGTSGGGRRDGQRGIPCCSAVRFFEGRHSYRRQVSICRPPRSRNVVRWLQDWRKALPLEDFSSGTNVQMGQPARGRRGHCNSPHKREHPSKPSR